MHINLVWVVDSLDSAGTRSARKNGGSGSVSGVGGGGGPWCIG